LVGPHQIITRKHKLNSRKTTKRILAMASPSSQFDKASLVFTTPPRASMYVWPSPSKEASY